MIAITDKTDKGDLGSSNELKFGYDSNGVVDEEITFNIKCSVRKRWAPHLISMLKRMEQLGVNGQNRTLSFSSNGDGDFRPSFVFDGRIPEPEPAYENDGDMHFSAD